MSKKIIIAGGTGFIGNYLNKKFTKEGHKVLIISRHAPSITWHDNKVLPDAINGADVLINLAGKSVNCRYTAKNKALIIHSRVDTTDRLQKIADQCERPPKLWINSSTATIYRHAEDRPMDEASGEMGSGFSVDVAKAWEAAFFKKQMTATRKVALRIAIVLGKTGGVMQPYRKLVKSGLGGTQGNGRQMFSWIHIEDLYQVIQFIMADSTMKGVYNCAAPNPVSNKEFMHTLRGLLKPVFHLPAPVPLLKLGAYFIGTETELILKSRWVLPKRLLDEGYQFKYPTISKALKEILKT